MRLTDLSRGSKRLTAGRLHLNANCNIAAFVGLLSPCNTLISQGCGKLAFHNCNGNAIHPQNNVYFINVGTSTFISDALNPVLKISQRTERENQNDDNPRTHLCCNSIIEELPPEFDALGARPFGELAIIEARQLAELFAITWRHMALRVVLHLPSAKEHDGILTAL